MGEQDKLFPVPPLLGAGGFFMHTSSIGAGLFVTGTDTGVGKTTVAAALAGAMRQRGIGVGVMKPFQTGAVPTEGGWFAPDAQFLVTAAGVDDPMDLVCPVMLEAPLAPSVAANLAGRRVGLADVLPAFDELCRRHPFVIVEGAGGLAVPIDGSLTMRDLARAMRLPLLIVARPSLGTLNHTALTVEYVRAGGLDVAGIVLANYPDAPGLAEQTNPAALESLTSVPLLGLTPHDPDVDSDAGQMGRIVDDMTANPLLERLLARLSEIQ